MSLLGQIPSPGYGALFALLVFIGASVWLGVIAQRIVSRGDFLKSYFLGNRSLGSWALALTATVQSGGTFMGFPSLVYSFGWVVALWIASYMVVPLTGFGVLGKRVAQLSRRTGAITMPDLFRERFAHPGAGLISSLFIMFFMTTMMIAQFKAGALIMKVSWPGSGFLAFSESTNEPLGRAYYIGLVVFTLTVVGYTLIGGFLAAVWTDLFQSVMMFLGVVLLLVLVLPLAGGLEQATRAAVAATGPEYAFGPGYGRDFLPLGLAFSFFVVWPFTGFSSPASVVRVMACRDTPTIRRSMVLLSLYNSVIYIPLIMICICARAILPDLKSADEVIPRMAIMSTSRFSGGSLLAGLILAAPFGAVLSTVSSYLVVIASGLVRDIYQRFIRPDAPGKQLERLSHWLMIGVGAIALLANLSPVDHLQVLVVFSGSGACATFLVPLLMTAFWRRATAPGVMAGMICGALSLLGLFIAGWVEAWLAGSEQKFRPIYLLGLEPLIWGILGSFLAGIGVSLCTQPPSPELVRRLFDGYTPEELRKLRGEAS